MTVAALSKTSLSQTEVWYLHRIHKELSEISDQLNEADANERRYDDLVKSVLGVQDSPTALMALLREKQELRYAALQTISDEQAKLIKIAQKIEVDIKLLAVLESIFSFTKEIKDRQLQVLGNKEIKIYRENLCLKERGFKTKKRVDELVARWESKKALLFPESPLESEILVSGIEPTPLDRKSGSSATGVSVDGQKKQNPQQRNRLMSNLTFTLGATLCATAVAALSLALKTLLFK